MIYNRSCMKTKAGSSQPDGTPTRTFWIIRFLCFTIRDGIFLQYLDILVCTKMSDQVTRVPNTSAVATSSVNELHRDQDVAVLQALASETRYTILQIITHAEQEICVCDIEAALNVSQGAVSQALSALTNAGLVSRRKDGRWRYYRPTKKAHEILTVLADTRGAMNDGE